jgi:hypothetical protein
VKMMRKRCLRRSTTSPAWLWRLAVSVSGRAMRPGCRAGWAGFHGSAGRRDGCGWSAGREGVQATDRDGHATSQGQRAARRSRRWPPRTSRPAAAKIRSRMRVGSERRAGRRRRASGSRRAVRKLFIGSLPAVLAATASPSSRRHGKRGTRVMTQRHRRSSDVGSPVSRDFPEVRSRAGAIRLALVNVA